MLMVLFFLSVFMVFYAYMGYPLSLRFVNIFIKKTVKSGPVTPSVTFIITAFNEEKRIKEKLENTVLLDYPKDKLQILVASDGSTDRTHDIVRGFENDGVELFVVSERKGKENAQKEAIKQAKGDVIVFSDVATMLDPYGLRQIISNFADPAIGCVSSEDRLIGKDGKPSGEGFYVRYEMWLRGLESRVNSLVGLSGSFFAARKEVCVDFSGEMQSDFRTVLNSVKLGLRGISDPKSIGYYYDVADEKKEFDRKVRTVLRGMTVFFRHLELLNFLRYGFFSYQICCHKLLRWSVPFFLIIALISNILLVSGPYIFSMLLICQFGFYGLAVWGLKRNPGAVKFFVKIPMYFTTVNLSIIVAWWQYLTGKRMVMWTPSER
jgi:glycosyltransferase involved in cell wall biosynthesis